MEDIYKYMVWGDYDQKIKTLANMTGENWNFNNNTNNIIIKKYLSHSQQIERRR